MKIIKFAAVVLSIFIAFSSCQKQLNFETDGISVGTLQSSVTGDCSPVIVNGVFKVDSILTNDNYVDVKVDVSILGSFDIKSDTINGYSFSKAGTVAAGVNTIRLYASGKPVAVGVNTFTIRYGTTTCSFSITVFNATMGGALFTLGGSPGNCSVSSINGVYLAGQAMTAANTVEMTVNVTAVGSYSVTGTTVNGVSFGASGVFINPGIQNIFLTASGLPVAPGNFSFPVTNNATSCSVVINFGGAAPPVTNIDYIPETSFSNWSDRLVGGTTADTSYVQVSANTIIINSITYKIFEVKDLGNPVDSFYHRKNGGMYYQLYEGDFGIFDNPFSKDGLILDSALAVNTSWTTTLGPNTVGGIPVNVKITCQILAKDAVATVAGNNYTKIIKVKYNYIGNLGTGDIVFAEEERWYARGLGLIYDKINDVPVTFTSEAETTRIQIF